MTEQQDDIQRARDVLKKYRSYAGTVQDWALRGGTSRLIQIACDPDLLDAIDAVLNAALVFNRDDGLRIHGRHLAAAIIATEERMNA